ncbi:general substrate transporter [Calycina marina]|uniref:General substrate transporter n=1 Tax=Calycina marina TaxID=1763456 RepID=A0A9P7YVB5_9HELO|nr:general substrate transporter [Calycina marina]
MTPPIRETLIRYLPMAPPAYLICCILIAILGPLQFGYHLAELNAPQDVLSCNKPASDGRRYGKLPLCLPMSEAQFATVASMFVVGGFIGASTFSTLITTSGYKTAMRLISFLFITGSAIQGVAATSYLMGFGRVLVGIAGGASTVVTPLYISTIAPPQEKAFYGYWTQISINVGLLLTQVLGYYWRNASSWRLVLGFGCLLATLQMFGLWLVPESPQWLVQHGQMNHATQVLQRIRGKDTDIMEEMKDWERYESSPEERGLLVQQSAQSPAASSPADIGVWDVVKDMRFRQALIAVTGVMVAQQVTGINAIMMYSTSLLRGVVPVSSGLISILVSVANLLVTIGCSTLPEKLGRKPVLLISIAGMGFSSFLLALSLKFGLKFPAALAVLLFVAAFAVGLGPVPFLIGSELVKGTEAGSAIQSLGLSANYIATYLVAETFPTINTALNKALGASGWAFYIFGGFAVLSFWFVSTKVPETKGKRSMEEVWKWKGS